MTDRKFSVASVCGIDSFKYELDEILVRIGKFGRFQLNNYLWLCLPMLFCSIEWGYVFTTSTVIQRCRVPECDDANSVYQETWTAFSIPKAFKGGLDRCYRHVPHNRSLDHNYCHAENFDIHSKERCGSDFIFYDNERTISNEFGIYCEDEWMLSIVGTTNNIGQIIGIAVGGYIADKYGRKTVLAIAGFSTALVGIVRSFSPNYYTFIALEFVDNLIGSTLYGTCFIFGMELVGPDMRVLVCSVLSALYTLGAVVVALVAKYALSWRLFLRIFYIPGVSHIILLWVLPESVRWLLTQKKYKEVTTILQKAAKVNNRKLSDHSIENLIILNRRKLAKTDDGTYPLKDTFKVLFWRIIGCTFCWFVHVLVYYGLNLNSVLLGGNKFNNFIFISLIEIPGLVIPCLTIDKMGRRYSLFGFLMICVVCLTATVFVNSSSHILQLSLFLIGKLAITASFQVLYFFTSEIFPTTVRNSMLSFCGMFGRLGSVIAPQTPLMVKYYEHTPAILFSIFAFVGALTSLLFPETKNLPLPNTMLEAQNLGKNSTEKSELFKHVTIP